MDNFSFYIVLLVAAVLGFAIIKKVTTCLFRIISTLVLIAALGAIYYYFFM